MPTRFREVNSENQRTIRNLQQKINNLNTLNAIRRGTRQWGNLTHGNRQRIHYLNKNYNQNRNENPTNLETLIRHLRQKINARRFMYGYVPRASHPGTVHPLRIAAFVREGTVKPYTYGPRQRPTPRRPLPRHVPTLKEMAWNASGLSGLTNAQLAAVSAFSPYNLTHLRPKIPAPLSPATLAHIRRNLAARVIQKTIRKKYVRK